MEPTFLDDDLFFINKFLLLFREPRRGDLVQVMDASTQKVLIKRVVGLPGEVLSIHNGKVFLVDELHQEQQLEEPYLDRFTRTMAADEKDTVYLPVNPNSYFLMGDNRPMSTDSRVYGAVHRRFIYGLVMRAPFLKRH